MAAMTARTKDASRRPPFPVANMVRIAEDFIRKGVIITAVTVATEGDGIPRQYPYQRVARVIFMKDTENSELAVIGIEPGFAKNSTRIFKCPTVFDFRTSQEFIMP